MRIHPSVPLLVFLAATGTGCSDDGPPTAPPVPGSVSGFVTTDLEADVEDWPLLHVLVTVEGKISWTGLDGRYLIEGITPGSHVLIATRWDHLVHEDTVNITSGQVTLHDIVLRWPDAIADWRVDRFGGAVPAAEEVR